MKHVLSRILLVMMVLLLAMSAVAPSAMAADNAAESNATENKVIYVGMYYEFFINKQGVMKSVRWDPVLELAMTFHSGLDPKLFSWKSSNARVVSVNSKGIIVAKKKGKATITAKRKSNGETFSWKVTVKRNKMDNINPKPSATVAEYRHVGLRLKSVEIVSPSKVVAEYYLCCNFPSNWKLTKIKAVYDVLSVENSNEIHLIVVPSTRSDPEGVVDLVPAQSVSGFKPRSGQFVQLIKVTYTKPLYMDTNARLSGFQTIDYEPVIQYDYETNS